MEEEEEEEEEEEKTLTNKQFCLTMHKYCLSSYYPFTLCIYLIGDI